jgi:hypothetical protein
VRTHADVRMPVCKHFVPVGTALYVQHRDRKTQRGEKLRDDLLVGDVQGSSLEQDLTLEGSDTLLACYSDVVVASCRWIRSVWHQCVSLSEDRRVIHYLKTLNVVDTDMIY